MPKVKVIDAAHLALQSYGGAGTFENQKAYLKNRNATGHLLDDGMLLVTGSNGLGDYLLSNLNMGTAEFEWHINHSVPASARWYLGFAKHAEKIVQELGGTRPKFIIGHSLGGAVAQLLSCYYHVPAVTFAAPQPLKCADAIPAEKLILNIIRSDDRVPTLPYSKDGYRRAGRDAILDPKKRNVGQDHSMRKYIPLVERDIANGRLPKYWAG